MSKNKFKLPVLLGLALLITGLSQAQESKSTAQNNGTTTYTVGEVVYTTYTESNGNVEQGVQHAYEISPLSIDKEELHSVLSVFPNPTVNYLTLEVSNLGDKQLVYQLFDMQGKMLSNGKVEEQLTYISMNGLPTSTYFVHVLNQENKKIQSFKVQKN